MNDIANTEVFIRTYNPNVIQTKDEIYSNFVFYNNYQKLKLILPLGVNFILFHFTN